MQVVRGRSPMSTCQKATAGLVSSGLLRSQRRKKPPDFKYGCVAFVSAWTSLCRSAKCIQSLRRVPVACRNHENGCEDVGGKVEQLPTLREKSIVHKDGKNNAR
mmetsp:Transcript_22799/g.63451  ORF Transcript_22799/g.63451 Transcript_22799/m.63451 type:complete len:104 (+) Transcript_22799:993-1304(+)